ncbi:MAG: glycosyltransferase [Candidatus Margulisbacteria bacterium]|jgi:trehalose synthase|nr:glycosyltransferase [Candidatus Margulisiibacteriota bacterium]
MAKPKIEEYARVIRSQNFDEIMMLADKLAGKRVKMVNATAVGGGVAEILTRVVPLYNQLGLKVKWEVIKGTGAFFAVTKNFHNALHGSKVEIGEKDFAVFNEATEANLAEMDFTGDDYVIVHDPQPAGLIAAKEKSQAKWAWRCHIDTAHPQADVWNFLRQLIVKYDASIFSTPWFARDLPHPQYFIYPAIDPLSEKNRNLSRHEIDTVLNKYQIDRNRPLVVQVSRFDRLKDPLGVIETYRLVKKQVDCQLVLAGGAAADDPEGVQVLNEVTEAAKGDPDIHILALPPFADLEVNALQRAATVVLQKSLREGFGLTVTEALWKGKPVVASAVGGITLQVIHNFTGLLVHSVEGAAYQIRYLIGNPQVAKKLGEYGREHVREKFLITRKLRNYLLLFIALDHPGQDIIKL